MESMPNFADLLNRSENCATKNLPNLTIEKCVSNGQTEGDSSNQASSARDLDNGNKTDLNGENNSSKPEVKPEKPMKPNVGMDLDFPIKKPYKPGVKPDGIKDCLPDKPVKNPQKPINSIENTPLEAKPYPPTKNRF